MSGTRRLLELADAASQEPPDAAAAGRSVPGTDRAEAAVRQEVSVLQQSMRALEELTAASTGGLRAEAAAAASAMHNQLVAAGERARRMATAPPPRAEQPAAPPVRAPRMIGDAAGYSLCPDPLAAQTPADLMTALRRYRICAGEPSYRTISRLGRGNLAASTLCTALRSDDLPSLAVVLAVVTACGASAQDQKRFATAWRRLRLAQEDTCPQTRPAKPRGVRRLSATG